MRFIKGIKYRLYTWLNKRVKETNWYKNSIPDLNNYPTDDWYRKNLERNYDIINIGSSSGVYAFNYTCTGLKAFNWALQPQSLKYSFNILKQYFSILKEGGVVIIPICPFSGLSVEGKWHKTANDKYFHILDSTLIEEYQDVAYRRMHPLKAFPKLALKRLIKDVPSKSEVSCRICHCSKEFEEDAEWWIRLWCDEFKVTDMNAPLSEDNKKGMAERVTLLNEIINFCIERELRPVITIPPMHPSLTKKFSNTFCDNYIYTFINSANDHGIEFYNYMTDDDFRGDDLFYNSYFLNIRGARKFTEKIIKEIYDRK